MSDTTDSWLELYDAQTEAVGEARTATVGAVTARAITTEARLDEIVVAGGIAEAGGLVAQMLQSDFPDGTPDKRTPFSAIGQTGLYVLSANENNGILYITAGQFQANEP